MLTPPPPAHAQVTHSNNRAHTSAGPIGRSHHDHPERHQTTCGPPHGAIDPLGVSGPLRAISTLVGTYVVIVAGTVAALAILSATAPHLATRDAWVHAVIVTVFAVVLPLRLRAAQAGRPGALRAVGIISAVLFLVNVTEAIIPGLFLVWMRAEMIGIAAVMASVILLVIREGIAITERRRSAA